jgi:hypothetical protein
LTVMKYGVYAVVAVVFGVVLVGLLPGQLSNMVASPSSGFLLQGVESTGGGAPAPGGSNPSRSNDSVGNETVTSGNTITQPQGNVTTKTDTTTTPGEVTISGGGFPDGTYADAMYYGMMGVGFVIALSIYLLARRLSG